VPVEGQWDRVRHPLPSREKRFLAVIAIVSVLVLVAGNAYALTRPAHSDAGCVVMTFASTMGGATVTHCGTAAKTFCQSEQNLSKSAQRRCEDLGYLSRTE
jgi:hypothetical protein